MINPVIGSVQINDGGEWRNLLCYIPPASLDSGAAIRVLDDPTMPSFMAAWKASSERAATLFRLNDDEPGRPFWVEMSNTPNVHANMLMTVQVILTPAAV